MKIVFPLAELQDAIEEGAEDAFEAQGGVLGDQSLTLVAINQSSQELLFLLGEPSGEVELIDLSPTVTDEALPKIVLADGSDA